MKLRSHLLLFWPEYKGFFFFLKKWGSSYIHGLDKIRGKNIEGSKWSIGLWPMHMAFCLVDRLNPIHMLLAYSFTLNVFFSQRIN